MLMDILHFKWHELALFNLLTNKLLLNNFSNLLKKFLPTEQKTLLSKFGFKTISTGTVEIKVGNTFVLEQGRRRRKPHRILKV